MSDSSGDDELDRTVEPQAAQTSSRAKRKAKREKVKNDVNVLKLIAQEHIFNRNVVHNFGVLVEAKLGRARSAEHGGKR